jgi:hypothetical protein
MLSVDALCPFPLVAVLDLETIQLDAEASSIGFTRPPLKVFANLPG